MWPFKRKASFDAEQMALLGQIHAQYSKLQSQLLQLQNAFDALHEAHDALKGQHVSLRGRVYALWGREPPSPAAPAADGAQASAGALEDLPLSDPRVPLAVVKAKLLKPGKPVKHTDGG